jgi:hypothetical protein
MTCIQQSMLTMVLPGAAVVDPPGTVFVQRWEGGFGDWTVVNGDPLLWSLVPSPWGQCIADAGNYYSGSATPTSAGILRSGTLASPVTANRIEFNMRMTQAGADDGPILNFRLGSLNQIFVFNPAREFTFDVAQRARVGADGTVVFILPTPLVVGTWYKFRMEYYPGPDTTKFFQYDGITGVLLGTYDTGLVLIPSPFDNVEIYTDIPSFTTAFTGSAEYDEIVCYNV